MVRERDHVLYIGTLPNLRVFLWGKLSLQVRSPTTPSVDGHEPIFDRLEVVDASETYVTDTNAACPPSESEPKCPNCPNVLIFAWPCQIWPFWQPMVVASSQF